MVYATCSILGRENERLVREVLSASPRARLVAEIRDLPVAPDRDGGYAAMIEVPGTGGVVGLDRDAV